MASNLGSKMNALQAAIHGRLDALHRQISHRQQWARGENAFMSGQELTINLDEDISLAVNAGALPLADGMILHMLRRIDPENNPPKPRQPEVNVNVQPAPEASHEQPDAPGPHEPAAAGS